MDEVEAAFWVQQMLEAIKYMHAQHICHRDIKPDNFMVAGDDVLKVSDLGLATECLPGGAFLRDKCGTPAFMAPEQHLLPKSRGYGHPADIWAAGVSAYLTLFQGKHPFVDAQGQLMGDRLLAGDFDFPVAGLLDTLGFFNSSSSTPRSPEARQFVAELINPNAARRATAREALDSSWLGHASGERDAAAMPTTMSAMSSVGSILSRKVSRKNSRSKSEVSRTPKRLPCTPRSTSCELTTPLRGAGANAGDAEEEQQAPTMAARRHRGRAATTKLKTVKFDDMSEAPLPRRRLRRAFTSGLLSREERRLRERGRDGAAQVQAVRSRSSRSVNTARARQEAGRDLGLALF